MRCDDAQPLISSSLDEELSPAQADALAAHQESCGSCRDFAGGLVALRQRLRVQPLGQVPDVTAGVRARLEGAAPRTGFQDRGALRDLLRVAAVFVAGFVVSALVVAQLAPAPVLAADLGERVLIAQTQVHALSAEVSVVERNWHPDVPERTYTGRLRYRAPESLRLQLEDHTTYPSADWLPNDVDRYVDDDVAASTGLRPCPSALQPSCSAWGARTHRWRGRAPFADAVRTPLDIVVPATSFALTGPVRDLGRRTIDGKAAFGVAVSAAQARPLLDAVLATGNWREVHHADVTHVWLEERSLTPLAVEVRPAQGDERRVWAAARGLADRAGEPFLTITFEDVRSNEAADDVEVPPQDVAAPTTDAGFVDMPGQRSQVTPSWLPEDVTEHRAGRDGDVMVTSWSDGRAWLRIQSTPSWRGPRLFGDLGAIVRPVPLGDGTAYVGGGGSTIGLHLPELDIAIDGTFDEATLLRVAGSLGIAGEAVPAGWREGTATTVAEAAREVPGLLVARNVPGFAEPAVHVDSAAVVSSYVGAGSRGFVLAQRPGEVLPPPFDADVLGVTVRGERGRFTPARGALEWVEDGRVLTLESTSLGLRELLGIAQQLGVQP